MDRVNEFLITNTALFTEREFKSGYLFRMCSVATNLVTSLEFQPIRCATTPCQFGRTWNGYLATQFILLISTAETHDTSSYVVVPEYFGQNGEPANRNKERAGKKPRFGSRSGLIRCSKKKHVNMNFTHHLFVLYFKSFIYILCNFRVFPLMENFFDLLFVLIFIVSVRE